MQFKNAIIFLIIFVSANLFAGTHTLTLENDTLGGTDRHYTHGTRYSYVLDEPFKWTEKLFVDKDKTCSLAFAQYMYTPSDISVSELMEDDRPYGGWLYTGFQLFARDDKYMDLIEIDIGVVGEDSYAEDVQKQIHEWSGSQEPMGWDNQIETEPGFNVVYQKKYRLRYDGILDFDFIPHTGACIGNVFTYANLGALFRAGYNLPDDFGVQRMEPTVRAKNNFRFYLFVDTDGRYVARNIFLDGNTFEDSHSVDKEDLVGDLSTGLGIGFKSFDLVYAYNYRTKEFEGQEEHNEFGSVILSWRL